MNIIKPVIISMVDLVMSTGVRVRDLPVKGSKKPLTDPEIKHLRALERTQYVEPNRKRALKESPIVMTFFMQQHVLMSEKPKARANSKEIICKEHPDLKPVFLTELDKLNASESHLTGDTVPREIMQVPKSIKIS